MQYNTHKDILQYLDKKWAQYLKSVPKGVELFIVTLEVKYAIFYWG